MPFCDDLKTLFPAYAMEYCRGCVSIKELSESAKVKEIIWQNSNFQYIDSAIVKSMSSFFRQSKASDIFCLDCDGIILFEDDKGRKYMFLSELKSTFDTSDIFHAKDQIISSYLKINLIMHLLRCYNSDDFIVKGFIICLPPNKNKLRDLNKQQMLNSKSIYKTEAEFTIDLCCSKERKITIKPLDCHKLRGLPLGNTGVFKNIEFHYIKVPYGCSSITVDVDSYL